MYLRYSGGAIILIVLWYLNSVSPNCLPAFGDRGVEFFPYIRVADRNKIL